ncbi:MAG: hypothetical protein IPJ09_18200 [Saprospiraceae bacterium]|jgi:hypothetical protein|nr:hypothetical protein [Saprospiraceae bacterium]
MKHTKENWTLIISGAAILISFFGLCQSNKANSISSESNILSNRALNFQKNSFDKVYYRDSIQNVEQNKLVDKQLLLAEMQTQNQMRQILIDSTFSAKQLNYISKEYKIKQLEEAKQYMKELSELKTLITEIKDVQVKINLNPNDSADKLEYDRMIQSIATNINRGRSNQLIFSNKEIENKWESIYEKVYFTQFALNSRDRRGASTISDNTTYFKIVKSLFNGINADIKSVDSVAARKYFTMNK